MCVRGVEREGTGRKRRGGKKEKGREESESDICFNAIDGKILLHG
jgi:hypothetical protein